MYRITVSGSFSAAHFLRNYRGKCENLHGHNWKVFVEMEGSKLDDTGLLIDFGIVKTELKGVLENLDHKLINEKVEYFEAHNPSAENIARYIYEMMNSVIIHPHAKMRSVTVYETETNFCTYTGE